MTGAEPPLSSKRWLDRVAVWGLGAAVPLVCILGLWLLATARSHDRRTAGGDARGAGTVAAVPFDASAPPAIQLRRAAQIESSNPATAIPRAVARPPAPDDCAANGAGPAVTIRSTATERALDRPRPAVRCTPQR